MEALTCSSNFISVIDFFVMYYIYLIFAICSADLQSSLKLKKDGSDEGGLSTNVALCAPSTRILSKTPKETGSVGESKSVISRGRLGRSLGSDYVAATSGPGLSPSSSVGSLSSEKSTLNPNAKVGKYKINF